MALTQTPPPCRPVGPTGVAHRKDRSHDPRFDLNPIRGLVCLWIALIHTCGNAVAVVEQWTGSNDLTYYTSVYRFGVEFFLVLTGFLLAHMVRPTDLAYFSVRNFLVKRYVRLIVPYQVAIGILAVNYLAGEILLGRTYGISNSWTWVPVFFGVSDVLGLPFPIGAFWSMQPMFQFYFLWILGFWIVRRRLRGYEPADLNHAALRVMRYLTIGVTVVSCGAYATAFPAVINDGHWSLPYTAWLVGAGMIVYWAATGQIAVRWMLALGAACVLANVALFLRTGRVEAHTTWGYKVIPIGAVLFAVGRQYRFPDCGVVRYLGGVGRWSFSIYLTHMLIGPKVFWAANLLFHPTGIGALIVYVVEFAAILAGGFVFFTLVESPIARYCQRYNYRGKLSTVPSDRTPPLGLKLPIPV